MQVIALFALFAVASAGLLPASGNAAASQILRSESVVNPDSYHYAYETDQGIAAQEDGQLKVISPTESAIVAKGSARWTAPDGTPIEIQYVADENGKFRFKILFPNIQHYRCISKQFFQFITDIRLPTTISIIATTSTNPSSHPTRIGMDCSSPTTTTINSLNCEMWWMHIFSFSKFLVNSKTIHYTNTHKQIVHKQ